MPEAPLVGRRGELAQLLRLLDDAVDGRGSVVVVTGEAGLGKSRLLRELEGIARERDLLVLVGSAVEDGAAYRPIAQALLPALRRTPPDNPALRPYRAALSRLVPDWSVSGTTTKGSDLDPSLVLGEGVVRLLDDLHPTGCLLVVEDAHWADPDTLALLEYLAKAVGDARVLVAVSARGDGQGADVVRRLRTQGSPVMSLPMLTPDEAAALVRSSTDGRLAEKLVAALVARAEGLPLLVEELAQVAVAPGHVLADGPEPVPSRFAGEVQRRLDELSATARDAVRAGAVLGPEPDWSHVPAVTGRDPHEVWSALRDAVTEHLLVQDGTGLRWRHALTRDAVLETLLAPERAALATRAADVLQEGGRPDDQEHAARLLLMAGERARALELALAAAVRERLRTAYGNAGRLLDLADTAGGSPAVTSERVLLLTLTGRPVAALQAGEAVLEASAGDEHAELCLRLARAAVDDRRWSEAERYVERAGRPDDPRSPTIAADAAHGEGRVPEAAALADRAVELAESVGTPDQLCAALVTRGRIARLDSLETARASFARAAQVAAEHGLAADRVEALLGLGTLELLGADTSASMRAARELALDLGLLSTALSAELLLCDHQLQDEGPRAVRERVRALVEQAGTLRLRGLQTMAGSLLAMSCAATGDTEAMEQALAAAVADPGASPDLLAMADAARAHASLHAYDLPAADAVLDRAVSGLLGHAAAAPLHVFGLWALLRTVSGNAGDGGRDARERLREIPAVERAANRAALTYADAVAAGRAGSDDEAATLFARADAVLRTDSWWRRMLRLPALERAVVDGWGDPVPELRADLAAYERDGDERLAGACRDLLRRAGAPTRRGRGSSVVPPRLRAAGVTSRELDVLRLVRDGRSNAEIAERLYLSTRTVETHVAHLLAKSGTRDRTDLAAWARDQEERA